MPDRFQIAPIGKQKEPMVWRASPSAVARLRVIKNPIEVAEMKKAGFYPAFQIIDKLALSILQEKQGFLLQLTGQGWG
jgi:hypothetical protein